jgi:hypothetical protein
MVRNETVRALADFAREHGAGIEFTPTGGTHRKVTFTLHGHSKLIIVSSTPRGPNRKAALGDARRALRELSGGEQKVMTLFERDEARMQGWRDARGPGLDR